MVRVKKICKVLLFPHMSILLVLLPVATVLLVYAMAVSGSEAPIAYVAYVLCAYTLTVWCVRVPWLIDFFKRFKSENKYAKRWLEDERLRVNASLYGALCWNAVYAVFQLWLGGYHASFWYVSLAGYYLSLGAMRFFLVRHTRRYRPAEQLRAELVKYRACGWIFLLMNLALSLMIFFMVWWNRTFHHHEITTIMMAAYTFTAFTVAVVNLIKYRKYHSPVYTACKAISLAGACVSMLTLEATMLTTWGGDDRFRRMMLAATGSAVSLLVVAMAILMIIQGNRGLQNLKEQHKENINGTQQ